MKFVPRTTRGKILAAVSVIVVLLIVVVAVTQRASRASQSPASTTSTCQPVPPRTCDYPDTGAYTRQTLAP